MNQFAFSARRSFCRVERQIGFLRTPDDVVKCRRRRCRCCSHCCLQMSLGLGECFDVVIFNLFLFLMLTMARAFFYSFAGTVANIVPREVRLHTTSLFLFNFLSFLPSRLFCVHLFFLCFFLFRCVFALICPSCNQNFRNLRCLPDKCCICAVVHFGTCPIARTGLFEISGSFREGDCKPQG